MASESILHFYRKIRVHCTITGIFAVYNSNAIDDGALFGEQRGPKTVVAEVNRTKMLKCYQQHALALCAHEWAGTVCGVTHLNNLMNKIACQKYN